MLKFPAVCDTGPRDRQVGIKAVRWYWWNLVYDFWHVFQLNAVQTQRLPSYTASTEKHHKAGVMCGYMWDVEPPSKESTHQ